MSEAAEELTEIQKLDKLILGLNGGDYGHSGPPELDYQDVRLWPTHVEIEINHVKKSISLPDFKAIFEDLLQDISPSKPIALPFGCFLSSQGMMSTSLSCYYPERLVDIKFQPRSDKDRSYTIPMPNIIITHNLVREDRFWVVKSTKYFSTPKTVTQLPELDFVDRVDPSNGIFHIPLPNFYPDGRMCYGSNTMPVRFNYNLRGLDYYYQILAIAPFNEDLGINGTIKNHSRDIKGWFGIQAKNKTFDWSEMKK